MLAIRLPGRSRQTKRQTAPRSRRASASVRQRMTWPVPISSEASARITTCIDNSVKAFETAVADRSLEQLADVVAVLAFADQAKDRVERSEIGIDDGRRVLGADIDAVARKEALRQHFLGDQRLVGQRARAAEAVAGERRQTPVVDP